MNKDIFFLNKKAIKLEEHDEIVFHLSKLKDKNNYVFINVDSHSDMSIREDKFDIDIGNFISDLIYRSCFNEAIWIRNKGSFEFLDGNYKFFIGENHNKILKSSLRHMIYINQNSYLEFKNLQNPKEVNFYVRSLAEDIEINFKHKKWILSIDYDFFSCNNPYSSNLKEIITLIGEDNYKKLIIETLKSLKNTFTKQDLEKFKKNLSKIYPDIFDKIMGYINPEFRLTAEEIKNYIIQINRFIIKNFKLENCLGVFLIDSLSSGYTNKEDYSTIDLLIKDNLLNSF